MTDIDAKLEQARKRSKEYGMIYGRKETSDDFLKITYATLHEDAPKGSVPERDAWVRRQAAYRDAVERKLDAYADWKTAETYLKILLAEVEVWRTEQANHRKMDRAHL